MKLLRISGLNVLAFVLLLGSVCISANQVRHPVPKEHPRLLGSRQELKALSKERQADYHRVIQVARDETSDAYSRLISLALVAAIEEDQSMAGQAKEMALKLVRGPIRQGHVPFATDLALSALAYDLCFKAWTEDERREFHQYVNKTVDANVQSETHVFHNGWYGYKNWGIGLACYASYYENERARDILSALEAEFRTRAAPALELAGDGGSWAEGYYIHYWLYEWLFFCEVARHCEGVDYYAMAPKFFQQRALASVFETYPGIKEYGSRRCVPMGDGGGRLFGGDRDKELAARRILVNHYRQDPIHQAIHTFNETTPRTSVGAYAYKDFLWRDRIVKAAPLETLPLSHYSPGAGLVFARSSWEEDATYFLFRCGDRFTAHQHLDAGHFLVYKHEELAGQGGHYDEFGTRHDVNYHLRSIAHNTILIHDPAEHWPGIRAGKVTGNDGGQHHNWPHHNGAVSDAQEWLSRKSWYDIADIKAYHDYGNYLYVSGDATRAYASNKLERFTREIVFLRPGTFIILDRVVSARPELRKTWLLQAMRSPDRKGNHLVISHGQGRLFIQALLPIQSEFRFASENQLYQYDGQTFLPKRNTGPAPECRIEISPTHPAKEDLFLNVLTATSTDTNSVSSATVVQTPEGIIVRIGEIQIAFTPTANGCTMDRVR